MADEMYTHIASASTGTTGTTSLTFTNIPQTYQSIEVWMNVGIYQSGASGSANSMGIRWSESSGGTIDMHEEWNLNNWYGQGSSFVEVFTHNTTDPASIGYMPYRADSPNGSSYPKPKFNGILRIDNYANVSLSTFMLMGRNSETNNAVTSSSCGQYARLQFNNGSITNTGGKIYDSEFNNMIGGRSLWAAEMDLYGISGS